MTALTDSDWRITYLPLAGASPQQPERVAAAYPAGSDDLPGWTLLKDREHKIVKMLRSDTVQSIERIGEPESTGADPGDRKLRYPPDAVAAYDEKVRSAVVDGKPVHASDLSADGFVRTSWVNPDSEWVQSNGFQVRALFQRGDGQRFNVADIREMVAGFLAKRGVTVTDRTLEAFCFNYDSGIDLEASRKAAVDADHSEHVPGARPPRY